MGIPTWAPGQVLAAGDVNNWFVPLNAYKAADQSVTSSTTLANDNALFVSVAANCTYTLQLDLFYEGAAAGTGDLKWNFTSPSGTTGLTGTPAYFGTDTNIHGAAFVALGSTFTTLGTNGAGVIKYALTTGTLVTSSTAGTLQFQWAQNSSSGTATKVRAGSNLCVWRIA
jgi:hypothetical protein